MADLRVSILPVSFKIQFQESHLLNSAMTFLVLFLFDRRPKFGSWWSLSEDCLVNDVKYSMVTIWREEI